MFEKIDFRIRYIAIFFAIIGGIVFFILTDLPGTKEHTTQCIFHNITGIACPGCGVGRGIIFILSGYFYNALLMNPLSYIMLLFGFVSLFWIIFDIKNKKETYVPFLKKSLNIKLQIILYSTLFINWMWNIYKGL